MGINDFKGLSGTDPASSCSNERERVANAPEEWHTADTEAFTERSELSDHGNLNFVRAALVGKRNAATDEGVRHRCNTLIANIDGLKRDPNDKALMKQFAKNARDMERYKLSIQ
jgi:hypothetical protein